MASIRNIQPMKKHSAQNRKPYAWRLRWMWLVSTIKLAFSVHILCVFLCPACSAYGSRDTENLSPSTCLCLCQALLFLPRPVPSPHPHFRQRTLHAEQLGCALNSPIPPPILPSFPYMTLCYSPALFGWYLHLIGEETHSDCSNKGFFSFFF